MAPWKKGGLVRGEEQLIWCEKKRCLMVENAASREEWMGRLIKARFGYKLRWEESRREEIGSKTP